jgi:hypothetical protein
MARPAPLLSAEHISLIARGVSVIASSRNAAMRPSVMRAVGSDITPDGRQITLYFSRRQSTQLLEDVRTTGAIAVVFSSPSSHLSLQVKGTRVQLRPGTDLDRPVLERYLRSMEQELQRVGYAAPFARAMLAHEMDDLVALVFEPDAAFDQTPGPKAGTVIATASGHT